MLKRMQSCKTLCDEHELLLLCLGRNPGPEAVEKIKTICARQPDWSYFHEMTFLHRVSSIVYCTLDKVCPELVPAWLLEKLRKYYQVNSLRNMVLAREMQRLIGLFQENQIPVIVYKGILQANEIYGNLAMRNINDIDFVIHKEDVPRTAELMIQNGYKVSQKQTEGLIEKRINNPAVYQYSFIRYDPLFVVEIHWQVVQSYSMFGLDSDYLWRTARPFRPEEPSVLRFSPEFNFFLSCVHNEKHDWRMLRFLCDVAWALEGDPALNWEKAFDQACHEHWKTSMLQTILIAHILLGAPIPEFVQEKIHSNPRFLLDAASKHYQLFKTGFSIPFRSEWLEILRSERYLGPDFRKNGTGWKEYFRVILQPQYEDRKKFPRPLPHYLHGFYICSRILRFLKYWTINHHFNHYRNSRYLNENLKTKAN